MTAHSETLHPRDTKTGEFAAKDQSSPELSLTGVTPHEHGWEDSGSDAKNGATIYDCAGCTEKLVGQKPGDGRV